MGSSAKKKKEKQKDFQVWDGKSAQLEPTDIEQKPKHKVGKDKAKPSNFTDTSFKSKSMSFSFIFLGLDS